MMNDKYNWYYAWAIWDWFEFMGSWYWKPKYLPKIQLNLSWEIPTDGKKVLSGKFFSIDNPREPRLDSDDVVFWYVFHFWFFGFCIKLAIYLGKNNE